MMATAGATHSTLALAAAAVATGGGDSPVPVWTAQVQQVVASSSSSSLDCSSNGRMSSSSCSSSSTGVGGVVGLNPELCWQMVESGQTAQRRRRHVQRLFHQGRALLVKHLPRDVNEHEIRDMLLAKGWKVGGVTVSTGGSGPNWARAVLAQVQPDFWEELKSSLSSSSSSSRERDGVLDGNWTIRGHKVSLCPSPSENLLCVARLPRDLLEEEFTDLVSSFGEVRRSFLLYSEKTGESKGYGFVEYQSRDCGHKARSQLDGRLYEGQTLACDWLDPSIVTLSGLHSKLLYVNGLPLGFRDMGQFRKLFSQVANPPYCQIALKGGAPQDWGLVEFSQWQEAEDTLRALDGQLFHDSPIRVAFFIPGVRAINIYMKLINDTCHNRGKAALLPEPPSDTVFHQLQNLTKQNPAFVHSLQNIILTQIQHLNSNSNGSNCNSSSNQHHGSNGCVSSSASNGSHLSGQMNSAQSASNASLAASAQAALAMLLAAQQQPSNNSVPQPVPPPKSCQQLPPTQSSCTRIPQYIQQQQQHQQTPGGYTNSYKPTQQHQPQPQLPHHQHHQQLQQPQQSVSYPPLNINVPPPPFYQRPPEVIVQRPPPPPPPPQSQMQPIESLPAVNTLQQTLSALLGTLSTAVQSLSPTNAASQALLHQPHQQQTTLGPQAAAGALLGLLLQMAQPQTNSPLPPTPLSVATQPESTALLHGCSGLGGGLLTTAPPYNNGGNCYLPPPPLSSPSGSWNHVLGQVRTLGGSGSSGGPSSLGSTGSRGSSPTSSSSPSTSPARGNGNNNNTVINNNISNPFITPVRQHQQGTKRKYHGSGTTNHVLPSPEPSPEANYVGQHSQGLGGHYADSYFKRKKRN